MEEPISPVVSGSDRFWGAIAHLSAVALCWTGVGHIVAPMVIWLWKRDSNPFAAAEAKEAMNFNISITIYIVAALFLCLVLIGIPLLFALPFVQIICGFVGTLTAADGQPYRYPFNLRLVK